MYSVGFSELNDQFGSQIQEWEWRRNVLLLDQPAIRSLVACTLEIDQVDTRLHLIELNVKVHDHILVRLCSGGLGGLTILIGERTTLAADRGDGWTAKV